MNRDLNVQIRNFQGWHSFILNFSQLFSKQKQLDEHLGKIFCLLCHPMDHPMSFSPGFAAFSKVPLSGWAQIVAFAGTVELFQYAARMNKTPARFSVGLGVSWWGFAIAISGYQNETVNGMMEWFLFLQKCCTSSWCYQLHSFFCFFVVLIRSNFLGLDFQFFNVSLHRVTFWRWTTPRGLQAISRMPASWVCQTATSRLLLARKKRNWQLRSPMGAWLWWPSSVCSSKTDWQVRFAGQKHKMKDCTTKTNDVLLMNWWWII